MIYADWAATAIPQFSHTDAVPHAINNYAAWANASSAHGAGIAAREIMEDARARIAKCINCKPCEVYFTSGGTESDNIAVFSAANAGKASGKMHIIASCAEHPSVMEPIKYLERQGFRVTWVPVLPSGETSLVGLFAAMDDETCLVACMAINNEVGTVNAVNLIGRYIGDVPFLVDAVQAVGHTPIDVQKIGCTYLSMSAHKFGGPKGVGALYVRNGAPISPLILGGGQESGVRSGTENVPGIYGMMLNMEKNCSDVDKNYAYLGELDAILRKELAGKIHDCHFNVPSSWAYPGILSVRFDGVEASALVLLLSELGVCVSAGSACHAGSNEPSHVLTAMGLSREQAMSTIRISINPIMSEDDMREIAEKTAEAVAILRGEK